MLQGLAELLLMDSNQTAVAEALHLLYISSKPLAQIYTNLGCTEFQRLGTVMSAIFKMTLRKQEEAQDWILKTDFVPW